LHTVAGRVIKADVESEATILRERQLAPYAQCRCSFGHNMKTLPGESWHGGDQPFNSYT